jgi:3-deoxy-D-manno-octulosonic-acid transferase
MMFRLPRPEAEAMASTPLTLRAYSAAASALELIAPFALRQRALRGKEDRDRIGERLGHAVKPRPAGQLVWIHGASVGECMAVLPLIGKLLDTENRSVLVTSGTVTSAQLMAQRLPQRAFHQFAPLDTPASVARFLDHWQPDIGLFVDSEIWPNTLASAKARGIPLALINGRMSARSFAGWRYAPRTAGAILSLYDVCLAQDDDTAARLRTLGAKNVLMSGSLKADAPPLPADADKLASLLAAIGARPVFLASSTHAGEDEIILSAHDALRGEFPELLTIIAPRHPERGSEIALLCGARAAARRAEDREPDRNAAIYIADTIGELGLFYRVVPFALIGGSLIPHGGQNPLEPAHLGCAVLAGPHTANFAQAYDVILAAQGAGRVSTNGEVVALAGRLLNHPDEARIMGKAASDAAASLSGAVERTRLAIESLLASHART